jgi:hypothetical protein
VGRLWVKGSPKLNAGEFLSQKDKLGIAVHTYNPSYMGGRSRRIKVQSCPRERSKTLLEK